ncbi:hypothetical protein BMR1_01G01335 [Babesia microti strain RI]|uniref:Uncharacterized protein n=1 Tax=Babesia microti (strain RI) TaxID=1133968 RepID=I7IFE5_BABMR|nr:hypothetical protein BMR1_01G01335 [Babesia microti strain RI]CCF72731.1 hypothetical protein BMR1_01G01335 [Babesia microti strain RI]|eukprot:XP_012647340.1 hypothetical protein BMR1_01G01335 [Babesia microti strain RI]
MIRHMPICLKDISINPTKLLYLYSENSKDMYIINSFNSYTNVISFMASGYFILSNFNLVYSYDRIIVFIIYTLLYYSIYQ